MKQNEDYNRLNDLLNSFDGCQKASPKPFLLTRIQARMQLQEPKGFWADALSFFNKPMVITVGLILILASNIWVLYTKNNEPNQVVNTTAINNNTKFELSITVAGIYDVDNPQ